MIGKNLKKKNLTIAFNVLYAKKQKNISCLCLKRQLKSSKTSYSFNDSKWRKKALSCFEKTIKTKKL